MDNFGDEVVNDIQSRFRTGGRMQCECDCEPEFLEFAAAELLAQASSHSLCPVEELL